MSGDLSSTFPIVILMNGLSDPDKSVFFPNSTRNVLSSGLFDPRAVRISSNAAHDARTEHESGTAAVTGLKSGGTARSTASASDKQQQQRSAEPSLGQPWNRNGQEQDSISAAANRAGNCRTISDDEFLSFFSSAGKVSLSGHLSGDDNAHIHH